MEGQRRLRLLRGPVLRLQLRTSAPNSQNQGNNYYAFHPKGPGPHRGDWLRKYMALPPSQQEQQLQNDPASAACLPSGRTSCSIACASSTASLRRRRRRS